MKRLSLLTFIMVMFLGCQRSHAKPANEDLTVTRLTSCHEGDEWVCAVEAAIVQKTNQKREGMVALKHSFEASYAGRVHSLNMLNKKVDFGHGGFPEDREATIRSEFPGVRITITGENVAGFSGGSSNLDVDAVAEEFVTMWWNSPGHKQNMLGRNFRYLGAGVARSDQAIYATQIFH